MKRTLLIDLDDTLLENDLGRFIPAYFDLLAQTLAPFGPKEALLQAIVVGTQAMLDNTDPARTLAQAFYLAFEHTSGLDPAQLEPVVGRFYLEAYPQLAPLTRPKPGAEELLRRAEALGMGIAVATNPLMPRAAIEQRLAWAGVPSADHTYALITDVDEFHFTKPRLAYVAEALARLGVPPEAAVMIGNDPGEDLAPAAALGLPVFQITDDTGGADPGGSLLDAIPWLEAPPDAVPAAALRPEALIARLEGQLAALLTRVGRVADWAAPTGSDPGPLTPLQILCHLRDVERELNLPRLTEILRRHRPFLSAVDTDGWFQSRGYQSETPESAVAEMAAARAEVLATLRRLEPEQWQRTARHSLLGEITLAEWLGVVARHDLKHQAAVGGPDG